MRNRNLESLSSEEKEELESVKQQIKDYRKHGPHSFREHLQNFNDSVMSIIVTIIVLEIKPPKKAGSYHQFIADIAVFLIAQILRMLLAYFGALATWKDSKVVEAVMFERSRWRILMVTMLNVGLIILAFFEPELAMIMYIAFPLISFFTPDRVVF